jgi:hypothetical protein
MHLSGLRQPSVPCPCEQSYETADSRDDKFLDKKKSRRFT